MAERLCVEQETTGSIPAGGASFKECGVTVSMTVSKTVGQDSNSCAPAKSSIRMFDHR
jgi:hypothetical protein